MALDIGVGDGKTFVPSPDEPTITLDDDGYYWFLHPLFERLANDTGEFIDLYGDACFKDKNLNALKSVLSEARSHVRKQRKSWSVYFYCICDRLRSNRRGGKRLRRRQ
jgi:hypothetical protein